MCIAAGRDPARCECAHRCSPPTGGHARVRCCRDGFSHVGRAELREFCRGKIARYKVPRYWKMVDSFPMTVSGKPQKYLMREQAVQDLALPPARR